MADNKNDSPESKMAGSLKNIDSTLKNTGKNITRKLDSISKAVSNNAEMSVDIVQNTADNVKATRDQTDKIKDDAKKLSDISLARQAELNSSTVAANKAAQQITSDAIIQLRIKALDGITAASEIQGNAFEDLAAGSSIKSEKQLKMLEKIKYINQESSEIFKSEISKKLIDKLNDMSSTIHSGNFETLKNDYKLLVELEKTTKAIKNPEERKLVREQVSLMKSALESQNANAGFIYSGLESLKSKVGDLGPAMAGVAAGMLSDSGVIGVGALMLADAWKASKAKKAEAKKENAKILREFQYAEANVMAQNETKEAINNLELISDDLIASSFADITDKITENLDSNNENIGNLFSEALATLRDTLTATTNGPSNEEITEDNRRADNSLREQIRSNDILEGIAENNLQEEEEDGGFFSGIVGFAKILKGFSFAGLFASIGTALSGLVSALGTIAGFIGTILIPLVAIGNGIRHAVDDIIDLPADAGIFEMILTGLAGLAEGILEVIGGIGAFIIDGLFGTDIAGFIDDQGGWTKAISNSVWSMVDSIGIWIDEKIAQALDIFKSGFDNVFGFIFGLPVKLVDWLFGTDIAGFIDDQGGWFETISNIFGMIGDVFDSALNWIESKIRSIPYIGDSLANTMGFEHQPEDMSKEQLTEKIAEKEKEVKENEPGFMNFVGSSLGLTKSPDERAAELQALKDAKAKKYQDTSHTVGNTAEYDGDKVDLLIKEEDKSEAVRQNMEAWETSLTEKQKQMHETGETDWDGEASVDYIDEKVREVRDGFLAELKKSYEAQQDLKRGDKRDTLGLLTKSRRLENAGRTSGTFKNGILQPLPDADASLAQLKDAKEIKQNNFNVENAEERAAGREIKSAPPMISAVSNSSVVNSTPVTNIQMMKSPRNDDRSLMMMERQDF